MFRCIVLTAAVSFSLAFSSPSHADTDLAAAHAAIEEGNALYIAAMAQADARAFVQVYDPRGARFSPNGVVTRGRDAIEADVREYLERVGPVRVTIETVDLWLHDGLAYETGKWTYTYTPPGGEQRTIGGRFVTVWRQQTGGEWKIYADMGVPGTSIE